MRRLAGVSVVVVVLAALGLTFLLKPGAPPPSGPPQQVAATTAPTAATPASEKPAPEKPAQEKPTQEKPTPPAPFGFIRVVTDLTKPQPSACLVFSRALDTRSETHYGDWVKLTPAADARLRVQDKAVCFDGLSLGRHYKIAIASGLPAADGSRIEAAAEATVDFGDRAKLVNFAGQGFILTRDAPGGVTLDTVNVDSVALEVLRINDRLAPGMIDSLRSQAPNYRYALQTLVEQSARPVWSGTMETKGPHNEVVHTAFPLSKIAEPRQPGVYVLVAANAQGLKPRNAEHQFLWQRSEDWEFASQLVVQTDIALTAVKAADGLHVFARSLATAAPMGDVEIQLQARDAQVLGSAKADGGGHAVFAPGLLRGTNAAAANTLVAYGKDQDFALLDLNQPAFDLSDRGVTGRDASGPLDAFVYTERGIYRPGERIHAVALLRDRIGQAIENGGLALTLRKPNGVAFKKATLEPQAAGGFRLDLDLPDTASRGIWHIEAADADGKVIGETAVEVQDFVPQRLKVTAHAAAAKLHPKDPVEIAIDGRFLYGAPAGGLGAEAHMAVAVDQAPFPQSAQGYRFGVPGDSFKPQEIDLEAGTSNPDGHAVATGKLDVAPPPNVALKATVTAGLQEPGGRVTSDQVSLPIRTAPLMIGIRPRFKDDRVREGDEAGFEIIAVDEDGKPVAARLHWTLIERIGHYDWFLTGGRWNFHRTDTETALASDDITQSPDRPSVVTRKFDWGDYRLVVEGPDGATASYAFHSGWMATAGAADTPDKVDVTVEHERYKVGETARLRIVPPYAGKVRLMMARDKVFDVRELDVPREGTTVEVPVSADWGSGAYALVSLYRPADGGKGHLPVRAIGLAWIGADPGAHLLDVSMRLPDKLVPRQTVEVPVTVKGGTNGEPVYLTLAAVDEGILQLTRFKTPDPAQFYFGQRRLAVEIRDDYGHLLDGTEGEAGALRSGGDAFGGKGLPVVPTRSVALFEGPVKLDADGAAKVALAVPDFEGELRVMAIAYSKSGVGRAEAPLTVRDPVVPDVALPRFLAPGDQGSMTVLVDNRDGIAGDYRFEVAVEGAARLPEPKPWTFPLGTGERKITTIPIAGVSEGIAKVTATLAGPKGLRIVRDWSISVRGAHYPITLETVALQHQGERFTVDPHTLDVFVPGSITTQVSYSKLAGIDVPGLLQSLWRYPYGCTEQLSSTAFPLVYYDDPALATGAADKAAIRQRVQDAIDRIVDRQDPEGTFGLWRAGDGLSSDWLSLYALDFLLHAKAAGFDVADSVIERGYANAESLFREPDRAGDNGGARGTDALAYAAWLLAPAHRVDLGRLRQLHDGLQARQTLVAWDNRQGSEADPMALGQLSGALAVLGDRSRGASALRFAVSGIERPFVAQWWERLVYWSRLRDAAGVLAIASESGQLNAVQPLVPKLQALSKTPDLLSTQEKAWLLVAAHAVTAGEASVELSLNGKPVTGTHGQAAFLPTAAEIAAGYTITPSQDLWRTLVVHGSPATAPSAISAGLHLEKSFLAMDGTVLDPAALPQNRRFIVSLSGSSNDHALHRLALVDLLPAGWEIEAILRPDQAPDFLGQLTRLRIGEARDDRLVAALDLGEEGYRYFHLWQSEEDKNADEDAKEGKFHVAYVVRAVTPGTFTRPEAVVEDMYHPGTMARTAAGTVQVTAP
ncbi:membrane protein [Aliidongia dinghuensis]|uniref:Membrane protein n=1 Tax=Aliidongia dinghuensis TaxID=1867774 RepID=A0A8J2YYU3_9PROT|nr:alpha-2-macroglobulin [Aliidongia dinghuensis]GGF42391.1 membrane protein [Aliidongia dinghuensis]